MGGYDQALHSMPRLKPGRNPTQIYSEGQNEMSKLAEFRETEKALELKLEKLESLKNHPMLKHEIDFEKHLLALMANYKKSLSELRKLVKHAGFSFRAHQQDLQLQEDKAGYSQSLKIYTHPLTGETIKTRGKSAKLSAWKKKYGIATVDHWLIPDAP